MIKKDLKYYSEIINSEELKNLYEDQLLSEREISKLKDIPRQWVTKLRNLYGILPLDKSQRAFKRVPQILTEVQKQIIVGTLLGDAGVYERHRIGGESNCYYKIAHKAEQHLLIDDLQKVLRDQKPVRFIDPQKKKGKIYNQHGLRTPASPVWNFYRKLFYNSEGVKVWNSEILRYLTPLSLAYWFSGDGSFVVDGNYGDITLVNELLQKDKEGLDQLLNHLEFWGLKFNSHSYKTKKGNYLEHLKLERGCHKRFVTLIGPLIPSGVYYKIPFYLRDLLDNRERDNLTKLEGFNFSRRTPTQEEVEGISDFYKNYGFPYPKLTPEEIYPTLKRLESIEPHKLLKDKKLRHSSIAVDLANSYHPHIWETRVQNQKTALDVFNNDLKKIIKGRYKYGSGIYPRQMLIGIRQISKSPVNYPPATAKCVYDNYLPDLGGHVLDPSAGYSGRLLGAYYSKRVLSYTGLEPAKLTLEGSQKILSLLKSFSPEIEKPMNLHQQGAEEWKPLDKKGFFDLIFTSPPYFNHEWYSEEESQVCNFCKNLKDYENWIKSCLDNWRFLLKPSGKIIIQVSDPMTQSNTRLPIIKQWETAIENKGVKYLDRLTYESPGNRGKRLTETVLILGF